MSSLKPEDAVSDYSTLDDKQRKVLDDWVSFARTHANLLLGETMTLTSSSRIALSAICSIRTTQSDTTLWARSLSNALPPNTVPLL